MNIFSLRQSYNELELGYLGETVLIFSYTKNITTKKTEKLISIFEKRQPDIFFFMKDPHCSVSVIEQLRKKSPKTKFVMWMGDQRGGPHSLVCERLGLIDLLLVNNHDVFQFEQYKKVGIPDVKPFYDGFWEKEFHPIDNSPKYAVFFGGNNFKHHRFPLGSFRYNLVNTLKCKFNMVVHGNGWPFHTEKVVRRALYNIVLNNAKINIGCNHYNTIKYYEERFWENMASGKMHLTYYIPGMEHDFENHKHLVWFKTVEECCNLVDYYLKHDDEREKIAKCGRDLLLQKHTHKHRAMQLQKYFREILNT